MYNHVVFEISGKCNAMCKWCVTGRKNRQEKRLGSFISPEIFQKAINYLKNESIIEKDAYFFIYNWGEPFLHPQFREIVNILNKEDIVYIISTNASKVVTFNEPHILKNLRAIVFSMPGFSQRSYDKIHGFNLEFIKQNIQKILSNYYQNGFQGKAEIRYHVYQFNIDEISDLMTFAKENNLGISPTYAGISDLELFMDYLSGRLSPTLLKEVSQDLLLFYSEELQALMPNDYKCPYHDVLLIDEDCQVLTCCLVTRNMQNYSIGSLFDLNIEKMKQLKKNQPICKDCLKLSIPFIINNRPYPKMIDEMDLHLPFVDKNRDIFIWGTGQMGKVFCKNLIQKGYAIKGFVHSKDTEYKTSLFNIPVFKEKKIFQHVNKQIPFVIVANEYIKESIDKLISNGYSLKEDVYTSNVIRREI